MAGTQHKQQKRRPDFVDRAPPDRFCDLILTGGVTSAIAYPGVIAALGSVYRFNSIGGSSSGAGTAALAAAAEYRRRFGSADGFRVLIERTDAVRENFDGKTGLESLFQPLPQTRRLFSALAPVFADPDRSIRKAIWHVLKAYFAFFIFSLVAGVGMATWAWTPHPPIGVVAGLAVCALLSVLLVGGAFLLDVLCGLAQSDYGMCDGMTRGPDSSHPPITAWLHELIQEIAGRSAADPPLTFAELKSAPGSPASVLGDHSPLGQTSINLQMFAANVTHGRPYLLPQAKDDTRLLFRPSEIARLFPASVVAHLLDSKVSEPFKGPEPLEEPPPPAWMSRLWRFAHGVVPASPPKDDALRWLPRDELPIVVAARMSVSFPVLFTAVPVWAIDERDPQRVIRRCLISDGGICSGFPIHLFDCAIPSWPTFGVALRDIEPHELDDSDPISLPARHDEGKEERWQRFDQETGAHARLLSFVAALLGTAKDWNDAMLARMPGVRDRIVHVRLDRGEGGLNILMNGEQIKALADKGLDAGRRLLDRFAKPSHAGGHAQGWNEHRWVRFNVLLDGLARSLSGLTWAAAQGKYGRPLREQIRAAVDEPPFASNGEPSLLPAQAAALEGLLAALSDAERALTANNIDQHYTPQPQPEVRVRPPL